MIIVYLKITTYESKVHHFILFTLYTLIVKIYYYIYNELIYIFCMYLMATLKNIYSLRSLFTILFHSVYYYLRHITMDLHCLKSDIQLNQISFMFHAHMTHSCEHLTSACSKMRIKIIKTLNTSLEPQFVNHIVIFTYHSKVLILFTFYLRNQ